MLPTAGVFCLYSSLRVDIQTKYTTGQKSMSCILWHIEPKKTPVTRLRHRKHYFSIATARNGREIGGERCSLMGPCRGYIWRTESDKEALPCIEENKNFGHGSRRD
jgi:hypothetical protein